MFDVVEYELHQTHPSIIPKTSPRHFLMSIYSKSRIGKGVKQKSVSNIVSQYENGTKNGARYERSFEF